MNTQTRTDMMLSIHELHGKIYIRNKNKDIIAEILGSGHGDAMEYARLIAVAPELMEENRELFDALCFLLMEYNSHIPETATCPKIRQAADKAMAAIKNRKSFRFSVRKATLNPESGA
ncbi:MAG: hypothetical protein WC356_03755 [Candidatus Micrarchaeia archaeon]|jgi:hypothetical protein